MPWSQVETWRLAKKIQAGTWHSRPEKGSLLLLVHRGKNRFTWGADLGRDGEARKRYIAALRAADGNDYALLFALLKVR